MLYSVKVVGTARNVSTKYGMKSVLTTIDEEGIEHTIWRKENDEELFSRSNGERIEIEEEGKKITIVSTAQTPVTKKVAEAETEPNSQREKMEYVKKLANLYGYCLKKVAEVDTEIELTEEMIGNAAIKMMELTVKKFDI
jgi:hypothetical protein